MGSKEGAMEGRGSSSQMLALAPPCPLLPAYAVLPALLLTRTPMPGLPGICPPASKPAACPLLCPPHFPLPAASVPCLLALTLALASCTLGACVLLQPQPNPVAAVAVTEATAWAPGPS